jgi:hypothetical protein
LHNQNGISEKGFRKATVFEHHGVLVHGHILAEVLGVSSISSIITASIPFYAKESSGKA